MSSTWTKRVAAPIVAVAATLLLVLGASEAAAADSGTLSVKSARKLAQKIVKKQHRERDLIFARLGKPHRRSSKRIDFPYADRSTENVLCVARIVVVQTGSERHADLTGAKCHGIPSEILSYEKITRSLATYVDGHRADVRKSQRDYDKSLATCDGIVVPTGRAKQVDLLLNMGGERAFYAPLRDRLGTFATRLRDVGGEDPSAVRGIDAWDAVLIVFDELDPVLADPCPAIRQWSDDGWTDDTAPVDFDELKVERHELRGETKTLKEVAAYLADAGLRQRIAAAFAPAGLRAIVRR
jgi:hypothetical protein